MSLLRRIVSARGALSAAADLAVAGAALAAAPAVVTAALVGERARAAAGVAATVAHGSAHLAKDAARLGARTVGTVVTGSDPLPDGRVRTLGDVVRGMMEPPLARHTRRVWADRGHVQVEVAAPAADEQPEVRRALRRHLERLDGVEWATVNDVVGRVLVAIDDRRVSVEDVVGVVTSIEQARGGRKVFPQRVDHPADLEPFLAAVIDAAVDTAAVAVALTAKVLPIPAVSRHVTLVMALLDSQQWLKEGIESRIGPIGADLVFSGTSALLHSMTQSPTVPAINAAAAIQQAIEMRARRQVWRRRERELCGPESEDDVTDSLAPPGERPALAVAVATPRSADPEDGRGPLAGHPLQAVLLAGPHRGFTTAVRRLVLIRGAATTAGATGAWAVGRFSGPRGRAGTMGLAALITTQLAQTAWTGRRSPLVLATAAGSLVVLAAVVQTPGLSGFFGCTPLDPLAWGVVLASAAAGAAGAEVVPALWEHRHARSDSAPGLDQRDVISP